MVDFDHNDGSANHSVLRVQMAALSSLLRRCEEET